LERIFVKTAQISRHPQDRTIPSNRCSSRHVLLDVYCAAFFEYQYRYPEKEPTSLHENSWMDYGNASVVDAFHQQSYMDHNVSTVYEKGSLRVWESTRSINAPIVGQTCRDDLSSFIQSKTTHEVCAPQSINASIVGRTCRADLSRFVQPNTTHEVCALHAWPFIFPRPIPPPTRTQVCNVIRNITRVEAVRATHLPAPRMATLVRPQLLSRCYTRFRMKRHLLFEYGKYLVTVFNVS
jgi:hypothetical protein